VNQFDRDGRSGHHQFRTWHCQAGRFPCRRLSSRSIGVRIPAVHSKPTRKVNFDCACWPRFSIWVLRKCNCGSRFSPGFATRTGAWPPRQATFSYSDSCTQLR
jgi:hypothetical protein